MFGGFKSPSLQAGCLSPKTLRVLALCGRSGERVCVENCGGWRSPNNRSIALYSLFYIFMNLKISNNVFSTIFTFSIICFISIKKIILIHILLLLFLLFISESHVWSNISNRLFSALFNYSLALDLYNYI